MLVAVTLGLDPSDYKDKTQLKRAMYAANSTQRVAGPTPSVAGPAQADCVQSQPQDTLQVPSASAALASALDSGKFTLTTDLMAATLWKFITGYIDVAVAASTVLVVPENMRGVIIDNYLMDEPPAVVFAVKRLLDIDVGVAPPQDRPAVGCPVPARNCYLRIPIRQVGVSFGPVPQF